MDNSLWNLEMPMERTRTETRKYRVVCRDGQEEISLRTRARDQYGAFEQIILFLRAKQFDYQVVLMEAYGPVLPEERGRPKGSRPLAR